MFRLITEEEGSNAWAYRGILPQLQVKSPDQVCLRTSEPGAASCKPQACDTLHIAAGDWM